MQRVVKDKTVVVTGGAVGIGYNIAESFLKNGAKITLLLDVNEKEGNNAVASLNAKYGKDKAAFIKCDVTTDLDAVTDKLINTYQTIDVLVNNAGLVREKSPKTCINVNLTAVVEWTFKYFNHMRNDKGGKGGTILNIASFYGFQPEPYYPVYQATKFGVFGFSKSLGHETTFNKTGVRIVVVCPGFTETAMTSSEHELFDEDLLRGDLNKYLLPTVILQKPEAVAAATVEIFEKAESGSAWLIDNALLSEVVLKRC